MLFNMISVILLLVVLEFSDANTILSIEKHIAKRGIPYYFDEIPLSISTLPRAGGLESYSSLPPWTGVKTLPPSPTEVANAIASAKQASANVLIAQQQVQSAKEHVLNQQRIAVEKETNAAFLTHKSETAAAVQRSEAAAAAQAVVLAQQRLASAKATVSRQQQIASAKEAQAASALQSSAYAAAAEIQRTENEAAKIAALHRVGAASAAHHLSATKDAALAPLFTGINHIPNPALSWDFHSGQLAGPWIPNASSLQNAKHYNNLGPLWR